MLNFQRVQRKSLPIDTFAAEVRGKALAQAKLAPNPTAALRKAILWIWRLEDMY